MSRISSCSTGILVLVSLGCAAPSGAAHDVKASGADAAIIIAAARASDGMVVVREDPCTSALANASETDRSPRGRLRLASCKARDGKLVDALKDAHGVLGDSIAQDDVDALAVASGHVAALVARLPHVAFVVPRGVTGLKVQFDTSSVPSDRLSKRSAVDPGLHRVVAEGTLKGVPARFEADLEVAEEQLVTVRLDLKPSRVGRK